MTTAEQFLPMKADEFHILLALEQTDLHGYALLQEVQRASGHRIAMAPSPFYRKLKRLDEQGLLRETESRPAPELDDERRRYYGLSELGREVLAAEARRLIALAGEERVIRVSRG